MEKNNKAAFLQGATGLMAAASKKDHDQKAFWMADRAYKVAALHKVKAAVDAATKGRQAALTKYNASKDAHHKAEADLKKKGDAMVMGQKLMDQAVEYRESQNTIEMYQNLMNSNMHKKNE